MRYHKGNGVRVAYDIVRTDREHYSEGLVSAGGVADLVRQLQRIARIPNEREAMIVLALDAKHRTIALQVASIGTVDSAPFHPREIFRLAVSVGASAVILAHNHPSGDPTPSAMDRDVTERARLAGELLGIDVLDHVVVAESRYFSFAESGR